MRVPTDNRGDLAGFGQKSDQMANEILIEKQSHADAASRRSRRAANDRAACT